MKKKGWKFIEMKMELTKFYSIHKSSFKNNYAYFNK
jgi:hypothetical protein